MVVPELAPVVREVFQRRDRGATIVELQALLLERGIERSVAGVASMLRSRTYLGEIHFGELHNPHVTSRSSRIAVCSSGCSAGLSRAGVRPSQTGYWPAWECCAAGRAGRGW